jgi:hypothetical protein
MSVLRIAFLATVWVVAGCSAAGASERPSLVPASDQPVRVTPGTSPAKPGTSDLPASITDPVVADIARLAGVPVSEVTIISAQEMTFSDGSLGCPQPGMVYTQAIVDGYKIIAEAGGTTFDVRGSGRTFRVCSPAAKPAPSAT